MLIKFRHSLHSISHCLWLLCMRLFHLFTWCLAKHLQSNPSNYLLWISPFLFWSWLSVLFPEAYFSHFRLNHFYLFTWIRAFYLCCHRPPLFSEQILKWAIQEAFLKNGILQHFFEIFETLLGLIIFIFDLVDDIRLPLSFVSMHS